MILITGANGNLGRRLLTILAQRGEKVRAVVRSSRAAEQIQQLDLEPVPELVQLDYLDAKAMGVAMQGCRAVVHLVGIIKESAASTYQAAHEGTTRVIAEQAPLAGIERIVYLSIVGTSVNSTNSCLRSKALGENILRSGSVATLVLRVPMVLGEGDYASGALQARAWRDTNVLLRGSSLEQPIYAGDVVSAVVNALDVDPALDEALDLAGPQSLSRAELTRAAARSVGRTTRTVSLPLLFGLVAAWVLERVSDNPPVTRAMLGVLDHDDQIDSAAALSRLGIKLTPLDKMLQLCLSTAMADS